MGAGAFVMVRREKSASGKRPLTSPPQWPITRRRGAWRRRSSPNLGLSQVVMSASASRRAKRRGAVRTRPATRIQRKERRSRRRVAASKNEPKSGAGASTTTRGRSEAGMAGSDRLDQATARFGSVTHQRYDQRGRDQGREAGHDQDRREGEAVGDDPDEVGREQRPPARGRSGQARHGGDGAALEKVRRQRERHRRHHGVRERGQGKAGHQQEEPRGEGGGDQREHTKASGHDEEAS